MTSSWSGQGLPPIAQARMAEIKASGTWSSALTTDEFASIKSAGFDPVGQVLGAAVYNIGYRGGYGCPSYATFGTYNRMSSGWMGYQPSITAVSSSGSGTAYGPLVRTLYAARRSAIARMTAECASLGGHGVVGVSLTIGRFPAGGLEFKAIGTAVRAPGAMPLRRPFTSDLSGQDFWTLIRAGYAPLSMVMGSCVYHIAHQRIGGKIGNIGRNVELEQFTQALYDARELAMSRMQAEAEELHAEGIVGVQLRQHSHTWGSHTTEFFAIGTAVRPLREDHVIERPTMVLSLDG